MPGFFVAPRDAVDAGNQCRPAAVTLTRNKGKGRRNVPAQP
jgi:hypothetical protein